MRKIISRNMLLFLRTIKQIETLEIFRENVIVGLLLKKVGFTEFLQRKKKKLARKLLIFRGIDLRCTLYLIKVAFTKFLSFFLVQH